MATINYWVSNLRRGLKNQSALLAKPLGLDLLSKAETTQYLAPFQVSINGGDSVDLPRVVDDQRVIFAKTDVTAPDARVWRYEGTGQKMKQLRCGIIQIDRKVLNTDFGTSALFKDVLQSGKRSVSEAQTLIAPWSHYWGGYYDYLLFVAAKLCRIKDALPQALFDESVVAYPLLHTAFERELLALIGFQPHQIVDSRVSAVRFDTCILGNNDTWFYPNRADVLSLRKHISSLMATQGGTSERIYISRSGRRRVVNEDALIGLLKQYGFAIIDDRSRSISEQYALYHNASFIIGPHGASFANVVWCQPGAQLFELFAPGYTPDYFRYLAQALGLTYYACCQGAVTESHYSNVDKDIHVDIDQLDKRLRMIFGETTGQPAERPNEHHIDYRN